MRAIYRCALSACHSGARAARTRNPSDRKLCGKMASGFAPRGAPRNDGSDSHRRGPSTCHSGARVARTRNPSGRRLRGELDSGFAPRGAPRNDGSSHQRMIVTASRSPARRSSVRLRRAWQRSPRSRRPFPSSARRCRCPRRAAGRRCAHRSCTFASFH
jgi:hypothetical protein